MSLASHEPSWEPVGLRVTNQSQSKGQMATAWTGNPASSQRQGKARGVWPQVQLLREPRLHPFPGLHPPPPPCPGPLPAVLTSLCPPQTAPRPGQGKEAGAWAWVVPRGHRVIKGPSRRRCDWSSCSKNQPVCHRQALVRAHTCKMIGDRQCGNAHWWKLLESVLSSLMDTQPISGV